MTVKKFYLTSEFWAFVAYNVGNLSAAVSGVLPPSWASVASAVSVAAYGAWRTFQKASATQASVTLATAPKAP